MPFLDLFGFDPKSHKLALNTPQPQNHVRAEVDQYLREPKTAFKLPSNVQRSSSFLQCPPEIRSRILRMLLHEVEPLEDVQLSSQLLSTCQMLHDEGVPILYGSNTLQVNISQPGYKSWLCILSTMGIEVEICDLWMDAMDPYFLLQKDDPAAHAGSIWGHPDVLSEAIHRLDSPLPMKGAIWSRRKRNMHKAHVDLVVHAVAFLKRYRAIERSSKIALSFVGQDLSNTSSPELPVFFCARALKNLLDGKHVTVTLTHYYQENETSVQKCLQSLLYLRCRSVRFFFSYEVLRRSTRIQSRCESVKEVIESDEPVVDTWRMYMNLQHRTYHLFHRYDSQYNTELCRTRGYGYCDWIILRGMAKDYDLEKYEKVCASHLEQAIENIPSRLVELHAEKEMKEVAERLRADLIELSKQDVVESRR